MYGVGTVAGATLTPSALTFPGMVVGTASFVLTSTLTNTGTAPLTGISVSALGDFTQTNACQATLAPGATCTISVEYVPTVSGTESGTLTVTDSLGAQTASLLGTALRMFLVAGRRCGCGGNLAKGLWPRRQPFRQPRHRRLFRRGRKQNLLLGRPTLYLRGLGQA